MIKARDLPIGWKWVKFGDITKEKLIGLVRGSKEQHSSKAYPYIKMDSILVDGSLNLELATRVDATQDELERYSLRKGDFLFNTRNSHELVGKTSVFNLDEENWLYNNNIMRVRFCENIAPYYINLAFHFHLVQRQLEATKSKTTSVCAIYDYQLVKIQIPLPPLKEQRRIAAILDKADAVRRKRQEAIALTEELLRAAFLEMFGDPVTNPKGWEVVPIGDISKVQGGLQVTSKRSTNPLEVPYLRVANVYRDRLVLNDIKLIRVTHQELERTTLQTGDLLVVEGHGNSEEIGRSSVWDGSIPNCTHQNHLIRVKLDLKRAEPTYISAFLNSAGGRRQLTQFGKTTSGLNTISTSNVKATEVLLPPLSEQKKYSELKQKIAMCLRLHQRHFQHTSDLFNSLLQRAFRGEL